MDRNLNLELDYRPCEHLDVPRKGNVDRNDGVSIGIPLCVDVPRKGNVDRNPSASSSVLFSV